MRAPASRLVRSLALLVLVSGAPAMVAARADAAGQLDLSTASLSFGPTPPGPGVTTQSVTVTNNGDSTAVVGSPSISGADKGSFWADETCGGGSAGTRTLTPGQSCAIDVDFVAATPGARSATMSIPASVGPDLSVTLSASTLTPHIGVSGPGAFPATAVGDSATGEVTVSSDGAIPVEIGAAGFTGADADQFSVVDDTCALAEQVAVGDSCTIRVRFSPTSAGSKSATLSIPSDAGAAVTVPLSGSTGSPVLSASPGSVTFPSTVVGSSARVNVTASNSGAGLVPWTSATLSGAAANQFAVDDGCRLAELIGTVPCFVQVYFRPTTTGTKSATLTLSAAGQPDQTISLSGVAAGQVKTLSATPSSLNLGSTPVGTSVGPATVTITNTGNVQQVVSQDTFGVAATNYFYDLNCPLPLAPGEHCTALVWFRPSSTGNLPATLTVVGSGTSTPVSLSGTGVAGPPGVTYTPGIRQFGATAVGAFSGTFTQTVNNSGPPFSVLGAPFVAGPSASQFQIQGGTCAGATVPSGGSCTVTMRFAPTAMGLRAATLSLPTSLGGPPLSFGLNGIATRGFPNPAPSAVDLGTSRSGVPAASQTVTVTNTGNGSMTGSAPTIDGPDAAQFSIVGNSCSGLVMAKNDTCTVTVTFTPDGRGARSATLHVASTAGVERTVALSGTGLSSTVSADASALAYGDQPVGPPSAPLTATLTNNGNASLNLGPASLTGSDADQFLLAPDGCGNAKVAPGDDCLVTVRFDPTARGAKSATLTLPNDAGPPITITLAGTGTQAVASLNPPARDFGSQPVGHPTSPSTFTVTDIGNDPLLPGDLTFGGADPGSFDLMGTTCPGASLPHNATCSVSVRFNPSSAGGKSATLTLDHNGTGAPSVIALSGTGLAPVADPSTNAFDFGEVRVGDTSEPRTVTLANTGTADLVVGATSLSGPDQSVYDVTADQCAGQTIAPTGSCDVTVRFSPTARGATSATLSIAHNATGSPTTVALTGVGIFPVPQISDDDVDFGTVDRGTASSTTTLTLSNVGNTGLVVGAVNLTGADAAQFALGAQSCANTTVPPAGSCTVDVRFAPSTVGSKTAQLQIVTDAGAPTTVDLAAVAVPKSDLKILGIGSVYTGKDHLVTRTVKTSGTLMKYKLGVVNEDAQATTYKFRLTPSGAAATAQVWSTGVGAHVLPTDGAGNFVTGAVLPGKTVGYELRVTPTVPGQVIAGVEVALLSSGDAVIEKVSTQTNTAAPVNGTSGFELFAGNGSQPLVGGPVDGQTVTAGALKVGAAASFRVRLKNNSAAPRQIGLRLTPVTCGGAFTVTVKAGATVITTAALAGTYVTPALGAGKYKDITVSVKRTAAGCGAGLVRAQSLDSGAPVRTSYLLANAAYDAVLD